MSTAVPPEKLPTSQLIAEFVLHTLVKVEGMPPEEQDKRRRALGAEINRRIPTPDVAKPLAPPPPPQDG